ncbi:MAG: hypothetical protein ABIP14_10915 [Blastocatellia bacterium]
MKQQDEQSIEQSSKIEDLAVQNTNVVKGGTKLPPPTTPIISPQPPRK